MVNTLHDLLLLSCCMSTLTVVLGYRDGLCTEECNNDAKFEDGDTARADLNASFSKTSNMADFLFTAPCPPIWNFALACNYFSRETITCEESTAILKRCLRHYDSYIPCNTTIDVIEKCMEENFTMCESLYNLYDNYCFNTCKSYCEKIKERDFIQNDTDSGLTLNGRSFKGNNSSDVHTQGGDNSSNTVVHYFTSNGKVYNITTRNNTNVKVIRVVGVRARTKDHWTCGILCIIAFICGSIVVILLLATIIVCTLKRYQDDSSYKVHSKDKSVGPDDSGIAPDSSLLSGISLKDRQRQRTDIPRRYRNFGVEDTSFSHVRYIPNGTARLLPDPIEDIERL